MSRRPELRIREQGKSAVLRLPLGDGSPTITRGMGGWETAARRGKVALTRYAGADPLGQDIPILLDGWAQSRSVQPQINRLIQMARPVDGDPPVLVIGGPVHRTQLKWVIENIQWGDAIQLPGVGIVRQELTLQLLQYVRPDRVRVRRLPKVTSQWGPTEAVKGDTWRKLAARHLGDASRWKEIARLNGNKPATPTRELKTGRKIRLP